MAVTSHKDLSGLNIHTPITWSVADSTERLALSVTSLDTSKFAFQADNNKIYILKSVGPNVWVDISSSSPITPGYIYSQLTPSSLWTITHNLGYKPTIQIMSLGYSLIDTDIVHVDNNIFTVSFNLAFSGYAKYI